MVRTCLDGKDLAQTAVQVFREQFKKSVRRSGRFSVVLSGGHTPELTYQLLGETSFQQEIDWSQVNVFWGDERCVPSDSPQNNFGMAKRILLSKVPIPSSQIFPIPDDPKTGKSAEDYESTLRKYFDSSPPSFDLVFLGLGQDGHTASLFPGSPGLNEKTKWVTTVKNETEDFARITLTPWLLNQSKMVVFLVSGEDKTAILNEVMREPDKKCLLPAQLIHPCAGELLWLISP